MKKILTVFVATFWVAVSFGQNAAQLPEFQLVKQEFQDHLTFLAADALGGRRTGSMGGHLAATYIAKEFGNYGVKPVPGQADFFQIVPFREILPPKSASLTLGENKFLHGSNLLVLQGGQADLTAMAVFAGYGWADEATGFDDYKNLDVKGKVVFVLPNVPGSTNPFDIFQAMPKKRELAKKHGAVGIVELFRLNFPWRFFVSNFNKTRLELAENQQVETGGAFFHAFLQEPKPNPVMELEGGAELPVSFSNSGMAVRSIAAPNVVGFIEGTDDSLRNEYVLISAHYDHVGVGSEGGAPFTPQDSIFNGARDNGMGTVALLAAAKSLAAQPPKRSVILLACTGEEVGLLGSEYYVNNPLLPLAKTVFNLNNDGAGYNSTAHYTVIGLGKTNADLEIERAGEAIGLFLVGDPAPEQNLYERSDNFSFAKKGIPAIDMAPGITEMNEDVFKYYHQAADNPDTIDYDYLLVFCKTFAHLARLMADKTGHFEWMEGAGFKR